MPAQTTRRRLSAILAADLVGYSRLTEENETGAYSLVRSLRDEVIEPKIGEHQGRLVKTMGDGFLVEFGSATDAVSCALALQEALPSFNESRASALQLRIGVNLGEVIVDGDDIFGEGVNIATRLEALAEPETICLSEEVHHLVQKRIEGRFEPLGELRLKNIEQPVVAYRLRAATQAGAKSTASPEPASSRPAIAVLPFDNMSGDPEQEYFSDGLTEDIITALSLWRSFPVIARNSSFTYKGRSVRAQDVARDLGVRYLLEGSVRQAGKRIRVTAQLINAETGHHVWAEKFDRELADIFDLQDEITHRIAATLVPELEQAETTLTRAKRPGDLTAWDCYLRGMSFFHEETGEAIGEAIAMFEAAVEADPDYVDAWALLGWSYAKQVSFRSAADPEETMKRAFQAGRRAVALDPSSAVAHMSLGTVHIWAEETEQGLAEAQRALELNPNFAYAAMAVGNRLDLVGRSEQGIRQMEEALHLNPRDPVRWRYMFYLSRAQLSVGDLEAADLWSAKALSIRPELPEALFRHALVQAHLGRLEEAKRDLLRLKASDPALFERMKDWRPYSDESRNAKLMAPLRENGLMDSL
ncbi:MAG: adenylate/guanylate cyclase domain-containing protein [Limibacillus sp.]